MRYFKIIIITLLIMLAGCKLKPDTYDTEGNPVRFSAYRGQWIVINYWASFCKPCFREIPALNKFYAAYRQKSVQVFGVSYDGVNGDRLHALIKKMQIQFPTLTTDPKQVFGIEHIAGLPETLIINPKGHVAEILMGEQTEESLRKAIGAS